MNLIPAAAVNPLLRYYYGDPGHGGPAAFQGRFHRAQHRKRAKIAANKLGKTYSGAAEGWSHLLGWHPYRSVPEPGALGWLLCQDHTTGWPSVSHCLHQLQPPGVLAPGCHYIDGVGYQTRQRNALVLANGSRLECKSGKQDLLAFEGPRVQWGWVDEPPDQARFNALRARMSMDMGPLWLTLTPVGRPVEFLRNTIEGNPDTGEPATEPDWWIEHVELCEANAPHRTPESIQAQIDECDPWERAQRIMAQWEGVAIGRRLAAFGEGCVITDDDVPEEVDELRLGFDWGEGAGKTRAYLVAVRRPRIYLLREFASSAEGGWRPRDYARGVLDMLSSAGLTVHHVTRAVGDTNSAGLLQAGAKFNSLMEQALCEELRASRLPWTIEPAVKRRGAPAASVSAMNAMMREGKWLVHETCGGFIRSARYFTGAEKDLKDAIDAARYPVMDLLLAPHEGRGGSHKLVF